MRYPAVFFDMDGTLIDSLDFHTHTFHRFLVSLDAIHPPEKTRGLMGCSTAEVFAETLPPGRWQEAHVKLGAFYETLDVEPGQVPLLPGVRVTLGALQAAGVKLYLVSNSRQELVDRVMAAHRLDCFLQVVGAGQAPSTKAQRCTQLVCNQGLSGLPLLYAGDSAGDVEAAREAGMDSCLLVGQGSWVRRRHADPKTIGATHTLTHFDELVSLVLNE